MKYLKLWKTLPDIWSLAYSGHIDKIKKALSEMLSDEDVKKVLLGKLFLDSNGSKIDPFLVKPEWVEDFKKIRIRQIYKHKDTDQSYLESCERRNILTSYQQFLVNNYTSDIYTTLKEDFKKYILFTTENIKKDERWYHGVITRDGTIYLCGDMGHNNLYDKLKIIKESDVDCWTNDDKNLKFTYLDFMGTLTHNICNFIDFGIDDVYVKDKIQPTQNQLNSIMNFKNTFRGIYGELREKSIVNLIRKYTIEVERYGAKFGNLIFLEKYYLNKGLKFKLPNFCKLESELKFKNSFLRTSPKISIPGLLNSKKVNFENFEEIIKSMNNEFDLINTDSFRKNSLYIFEQEFIKGITGVASFINDEFSFAVSDKESDVVSGIVKNIKISDLVKLNLENFCKTLSIDLKQNIQVEFVIKKDTLYIVQLRTLKNLFQKDWNKEYNKSEILISGKSFCQGYIEHDKTDNIDLEVKKEDILIVCDDCDSKLLTENIKLVLVENDISFSHILALTSVKKIKSIFGIGKIDFEKIPDIVKVDSMGKIGYVLK